MDAKPFDAAGLEEAAVEAPGEPDIDPAAERTEISHREDGERRQSVLGKLKEAKERLAGKHGEHADQCNKKEQEL